MDKQESIIGLARGTRKDTGKEVEGYHVRIGERDYIIPLKASAMYGYAVVPGSICRGMGMEDRNGKQIFENDVIRYDGTEYVVRYSAYCAEFSLRPVTRPRYRQEVNEGVMRKSEVTGEELRIVVPDEKIKEIRRIQGEIDHRTAVEKEAEELICQCRLEAAMHLMSMIGRKENERQ